MFLNRYGLRTPLARWAILAGLCSIAVAMLSYFQIQRHEFVSTTDFEFVFLERIALVALLVGLVTTIVGAFLWARQAPPRNVALCGFALLILLTVAQQFSSPNFYAWSGALALVGATGRLIGLAFLVFAAVHSLRHRRTKGKLEATFEHLQAIDWTLLLAVPLYLLVPTDTRLAQALSRFPITAVCTGIAVAVFILALSTRSKILRPASAALLLRPNDALTLKNWRAGHLLSFVLSHSIAVYGLVIQMAGHPRYESFPFYVAACLLLLVWMPHPPKS